MRIEKYLIPERVIELKSRDKESAFKELIDVIHGTIPGVDRQALLKAILKRENIASSWVENQVAIPHARLKLRKGFVVALGRSRQGIEYYSADREPVRILVMIVGQDERNTHLKILAAVASILKNEAVKDSIVHAKNTQEIYTLFTSQVVGKRAPSATRMLTATNRVLLQHAQTLVQEVKAEAMFIDADILGRLDVLKHLEVDCPLVLTTTRNQNSLRLREGQSVKILPLPSLYISSAEKVKLSMLLALSWGLVKRGDEIVYVTGASGSRALDTVKVLRAGEEYKTFFAVEDYSFDKVIRHEVLERMIHIACDIANEGREGKPVGALFVLGDIDRVLRYSRPLIINPFKGYLAEERNVLDPGLEETVKEFSTLDGAFIVDRDGIVVSCGVYLRSPAKGQKLPSGLGARHVAAASITANTKALSIAISESTGTVTLFKQGKVLLKIEKSKGES